jgi:hypothetical protein
MKNYNKYNFYKNAFELMELAKIHKSLHYSTAAVAIIESIIADRTQSYIAYKEKEWFELQKEKHIKTIVLVDKCNKYFRKEKIVIKRRYLTRFESNDLFIDIKEWLKKRNNVLHSFAKSSIDKNKITYDEFVYYTITTTEEGIVLVTLLNKWFKNQKK